MRRDHLFGFCAVSALALLMGADIALVMLTERIGAGASRARRLLTPRA